MAKKVTYINPTDAMTIDNNEIIPLLNTMHPGIYHSSMLIRNNVLSKNIGKYAMYQESLNATGGEAIGEGYGVEDAKVPIALGENGLYGYTHIDKLADDDYLFRNRNIQSSYYDYRESDAIIDSFNRLDNALPWGGTLRGYSDASTNQNQRIFTDYRDLVSSIFTYGLNFEVRPNQPVGPNMFSGIYSGSMPVLDDVTHFIDTYQGTIVNPVPTEFINGDTKLGYIGKQAVQAQGLLRKNQIAGTITQYLNSDAYIEKETTINRYGLISKDEGLVALDTIPDWGDFTQENKDFIVEDIQNNAEIRSNTITEQARAYNLQNEYNYGREYATFTYSSNFRTAPQVASIDNKLNEDFGTTLETHLKLKNTSHGQNGISDYHFYNEHDIAGGKYDDIQLSSTEKNYYDNPPKPIPNGGRGLLAKTAELFNEHKINTLVGRFHTSADNADALNGSSIQTSLTNYGISHGRNLLKKNRTTDNGYDNPYCRVWTYHHQYMKVENLIRPFDESETGTYDFQKNYFGRPNLTNGRGGVAEWNNKTTLNKNGFVNIAPMWSDNPGSPSVKIKQCMFSIENLAWKGQASNALPDYEKGPLGGRIMWFPPYNLNFSENSNPNWNSNDFIGRGERVYTYSNTERSGQLSFTILADHPSAIDYWSRNNNFFQNTADTIGQKQDDLLRYFAGCDNLDMTTLRGITSYGDLLGMGPGTSPEEYRRGIKVPELKINNGKDTVEGYSFALYFPNNLSGMDWLETDNDVKKLAEYLAYGKHSLKNISIADNGNVTDNNIENTSLEDGIVGYEMGRCVEQEQQQSIEPSKAKGDDGPLFGNSKISAVLVYMTMAHEDFCSHAGTMQDGKCIRYQENCDSTFFDRKYTAKCGCDSEGGTKDKVLSVGFGFTKTEYAKDWLENNETHDDAYGANIMVKVYENNLKIVSKTFKSVWDNLTGPQKDSLLDISYVYGPGAFTSTKSRYSKQNQIKDYVLKGRYSDAANVILTLSLNQTRKEIDAEAFSDPSVSRLGGNKGKSFLQAKKLKQNYFDSVYADTTSENENENVETISCGITNRDDELVAKITSTINELNKKGWNNQLSEPDSPVVWGYGRDKNTAGQKIPAKRPGTSPDYNAAPLQYIDNADFGFNVSRTSLNANNQINSSFADFYLALQLQDDESELAQEIMRRINIKNGTNDALEYIQQIRNILLDPQKINDETGNTNNNNVKRTIYFAVKGSASSHGYNSPQRGESKSKNQSLAENRARFLRAWIKANGGADWIDKSEEENTRYSIEDAEQNYDSSFMMAKAGRSARVMIWWDTEFIFDPDKDKENNGNDNNPSGTTSGLTTTDVLTPSQLRYRDSDNEYTYFKELQRTDKFLYRNIVEKVQYFDPAFHSITPEGFNARLAFLHQCTRQGPTLEANRENAETQYAGNLAFGRPPVCVLRLGDFYNTRIIITSLNITYETGQWDINPEGIGPQPILAKVNLGFVFQGGSSLGGPISRLQNALSFNFYANQEVYEDRADVAVYGDDGKMLDTTLIWVPGKRNPSEGTVSREFSVEPSTTKDKDTPKTDIEAKKAKDEINGTVTGEKNSSEANPAVEEKLLIACSGVTPSDLSNISFEQYADAYAKTNGKGLFIGLVECENESLDEWLKIGLEFDNLDAYLMPQSLENSTLFQEMMDYLLNRYYPEDKSFAAKVIGLMDKILYVNNNMVFFDKLSQSDFESTIGILKDHKEDAEELVPINILYGTLIYSVLHNSKMNNQRRLDFIISLGYDVKDKKFVPGTTITKNEDTSINDIYRQVSNSNGSWEEYASNNYDKLFT